MIYTYRDLIRGDDCYIDIQAIIPEGATTNIHLRENANASDYFILSIVNNKVYIPATITVDLQGHYEFDIECQILGETITLQHTDLDFVPDVTRTYGGTGVNNGGRTLTVNTNSGTIAFSNASTTLTVANNASVSGTNTGDQTTITGNAGTATKLQTARAIAIQGDITGTANFDGSGDISITATLPNLLTAGTYNSVTVNAKGQVTAGTNTGAGSVNKYAVDITGNGSTTSFAVVHNLGTTDIVTFIKEATTLAKVEAEEIVTSSTTLTINFNTAPANGKVYRVVVLG